MAQKVRRSDMVEVIRGDHKGARGKVLRLDLQHNMVLVEGVNLVYRHVRPTRRNPQGGRIQKEAPIHLSNVAPYDSKSGRGLRVRFDTEKDAHGKTLSKQRVTTSGTVLSVLSRGSEAK